MSAYYTVVDVQDRIEGVLGERPTVGAIHLEGVRAGTVPNARVRITAGLPNPVNPGERPLRYRARDVESWLEEHPRLTRDTARQALARAIAEAGDRQALVDNARTAGLSWAEIADVFAEVDQRPITRQAVAKRYGPRL